MFTDLTVSPCLLACPSSAWSALSQKWPYDLGDIGSPTDRDGVTLLVWRGVVRTVNVRSNSMLRVMMVVISETVMRLTSSPSIATILSPGEICSAMTELVRTPDTTVPRESARLARMIPSLPGGAMMVMRVRRAAAAEPALRFEELRDDRDEAWCLVIEVEEGAP
jgi:hypothetical protein